MNYNGNYSKAMQKQISQASRALFSLRAKQTKYKLPLDILFQLFDLLIIPILIYGAEIWGCSNICYIEVFYKKILKSHRSLIFKQRIVWFMENQTDFL